MLKTRAAIVTTLRDADPVIDSFIIYHLLIGFDHIFLFFDDPRDPSIAKARKYRNVTVVSHDGVLRRMWKQTRLYAEDQQLREFLDREVMARQILNVEVAIGLAMENHLDWLLHIDVDELFYCPGQSVTEHFGSLSVSGIQQINYLNYEAIPERVGIEDYFKEVVLFKKNPQALSGGWFNEAQIDVIRSIEILPDTFFLFYGNGKSAARVTQDLLPAGVHDFWSLPDQKSELLKEPVILHYPCCGFEHFWRKYKNLGRFADKWFDEINIAETGNQFHIEARDVVSRNDREIAKDFYEKRVVLSDAQRIRILVENDLCCFIYEPSTLIASDYNSILRF
jgi:hypothetical protein